MSKQDRRTFLQRSVSALGVGSTLAALGFPSPGQVSSEPKVAGKVRPVPADNGKQPLRLGLIIDIDKDPDSAMAKVRGLGLTTAQVYVNEFEPDLAERLNKALDKNNIEPTALVVGGPGKEVWDFYQGPLTIGLVPRETRAARIAHIKHASDFAKQCGISAVQTHCGFIPENPNDPIYKEVVAAIREVATYCKGNGQNFRYETGQETPTTLVRTILDVGTDNQGVNFDLANLILYGKANPVDAIEILGPLHTGHSRQGWFVANQSERSWEEVPIGKGKVDFRVSLLV